VTRLRSEKRRQVSLRPMTEEYYQQFMAAGRSRFVAQTIASGTASYLEAERQCDETLARALPQGLATPDQYFRKIFCTEFGYPVGAIWYGASRDFQGTGYIYDFLIEEKFQRQGYGAAVMGVIDAEMRDHGFEKVRLHVFGNNLGARRLYETHGFSETNVYMEKRLDSRQQSRHGN
jgi:ribosomal protein S18 acetylase RimI-like enzyme